MKRKAIELTNVVRIFNKDIWALSGINLSIHFSDVIGIIGPKNSGKGVLGRILAGELEPTLGKVYYGFDNTDNNNIGLQFRETTWPDGFRVKDIVFLYKEVYKIDDEQWMERLYNTFRVKEIWNDKMSRTDPNMSQLFNLFLAMICRPKLLIMDSIPTTLGVDIRTDIIEFLRLYIEESKAAVVILAPDGTMFKMLCNRVLLMNNGKIIKDEEVNETYKNKAYEEFLFETLKYIKESDESKFVNPLYVPYIEKSEEMIVLYKELYKKYIEKLFIDKQKHNKRELILINKWKKILKMINLKLKDLGSYIENKNNHNFLKKYVRTFNKSYKLIKIIFEKIHHSDNEKISDFLNNAKPIIDFVLVEIKNLERLEFNEKANALKNKEQKELEKYKKKIIHEEERMLKAILAQQKEINKGEQWEDNSKD